MNDLPERALSIRQPWAWAILNAGKRIENRPRRFNYRGPICLHASLYRPSADDQTWFLSTLDDALDPLIEALWNEWTDAQIINFSLKHRGGIIGTAEIVDCVETSDDPWFFGPYGLVLENVQPVTFIPVKGALGLFKWRDRA